jgi:Calcineurin-like phosphoesterase
VVTRAIVFSILVLGCSSAAESPRPRPRPAAVAPPAPPAPPRPPSRLPAPERLVAVGDIHGDREALERVLRIAGLIDAAGAWIGGSSWLVQTGDLLDRGDQEDEVLALIERLGREAESAGGRVVALDGNHEFMNAQGDFRYVTEEGFSDFASHERDRAPLSGRAPRVPPRARGRANVFAPGSNYSQQFAARNVVQIIGETVFVHGGLSEATLARAELDALNDASRRFFSGAESLSPWLAGEESPIWYRRFALRDDEATCAELGRVLERVGARRMVVGHTVQEGGINSACDARVWRIDVGLSRFYGGPTEALELTNAGLRVLR